jgi:Tfp pilus assembly ATPase PilU
MQTFDTDLLRLFEDGKITREEALKNADSENELTMKMGFSDKGNSQGKGTPDDDTIDELVFPE